MKKTFYYYLLITMMFVFSGGLSAEDFATLNNISVNNNEIVVTLSGPVKFNPFTISVPPRIVIEFSNTVYDFSKKEIAVNDGVIKRIRSGQYENDPVKISRVVVDLDKMTEYQVNDDGNTVTLVLLSPNEGKGTEAEAAPAVDTTVAATQEVKENNSDEDDNDDNEVEVVPAPKVVEEPAVVAPIAPVEAKPVIASEQKSEPVIKKSVKKVIVAKPKQKAANKPSVSKVTLPTNAINLDFEDADIRDVLRVLSVKSGINIIYSGDVSGNITIHLENVPFDRAFDTILSIKGLVSQMQGNNIIRVATPQKIADERSQAVTFTKIFPLNYAKAEEVKSNLDIIRQAEGRKGNISTDSRTNSLIVTDTPEGLIAVEQVISELDKRPPQVIIEAKLIELTLTDNMDLGIAWQYASTEYTNNSYPVNTIGVTKGGTDGALYLGGVVPPVDGVAQARVSVLPTEGGTGVNFPAVAKDNAIAQFAFGIAMDNSLLTAQISALAQKGLSKILSNPRVTTINNQVAKIMIGEKVPFTTTTIGTGGVSQQDVKWQDVGIKLEVTPTINTDQKVTLKIKPEVSLVQAESAAGPVIATRQAETTVIVKNNETIVIGGLIKESDIKQGSSVPLLGELPVIGYLFKRDYNTKSRTELLIFLTPQIIE